MDKLTSEPTILQVLTILGVLGGTVGLPIGHTGSDFIASFLDDDVVGLSEVTAICESWCPHNARPWSKKCTWRKCSNCDPCDASPPSPPVAPPVAPPTPVTTAPVMPPVPAPLPVTPPVAPAIDQCSAACSKQFINNCLGLFSLTYATCRADLDAGRGPLAANCEPGCTDTSEMAAHSPNPPAPGTVTTAPTTTSAPGSSYCSGRTQIVGLKACLASSDPTACGIPCCVFDDARECQRDSTEVATMIFQQATHCSATGDCSNGPSVVVDSAVGPKTFSNPARFCKIYNDGEFLPELSSSGYCVDSAIQAYAEFVMLAIAPNKNDYVAASKWAVASSPADQQYSCSDASFCQGRGTASGEIGSCKCACVATAVFNSPADFERCTTIVRAHCTDAKYCGSHGTAVFTRQGSADEGTCACSCSGGYTGAHCQLAPNELCNDIDDCNNGRGIASGTRPNCRCSECVMKFEGQSCEDWHWP